ncbi:hypothetical protein RB195_014447 [Necator americanus]|uniref:Uncharacterized protein n=1 Tax=Necator americanus TaxID=51031 RepID=A0ABR1E047_NECAM
MEDDDTRTVVRESIVSRIDEPFIRLLGTFTYEAVDHYASLCNWFVSGFIFVMTRSLRNLSTFLEDLTESASNALAVPIALLTALGTFASN